MSEQSETLRRHHELKDILSKFGYQLHSWDPGVAVIDDKGNYVHFDRRGWEIVEMLMHRVLAAEEHKK